MLKFAVGDVVRIKGVSDNNIYTVVDFRVVQFSKTQYKYLLEGELDFAWHDENEIERVY